MFSPWMPFLQIPQRTVENDQDWDSDWGQRIIPEPYSVAKPGSWDDPNSQTKWTEGAEGWRSQEEGLYSTSRVAVQSLSHIQLTHCSTPGFPVLTISQSLLKLMSIKSLCHPTILSSVVLSSCLQSFPASGSFPVSQPFTSGGQNIGASALASVLLMNIHH